MNMTNSVFHKLIASLLLHGAILCGVACLWSTHAVLVMPVLQGGEFCLELGLSSLPLAPVAVKPPAPVAITPATETVEKEADAPATEPDAVSFIVDTPAQPKVSSPSAPLIPGAAHPGVPDAPRLESALCPIYPPGARRRGEEGCVAVRVLVNSSGQAQLAEVINSSGYPDLDQAAINAARAARFVSIGRAQLSAALETTLRFRFTLVN